MPTYISELEFKLMQERVKRLKGADKNSDEESADPGLESELMGKVIAYCKQEGFPCQCFRPSRKAVNFLVPGWPD